MDTVTITIRNVPDEVHAELVRRAKLRGMSLQAYMRELLIEIAEWAALQNRWEDESEGRQAEEPDFRDLLDRLERENAENHE